MQADFSVELGEDDPFLTVPWTAPDGDVRYYDLKQHPDLLLYIPEAVHNPELGEFLERINSKRSPLQTAKCDVWFSRELGEEEAVFEAAGKFGGYIDLFFTAFPLRGSFSAHEVFARRFTQLLARAPELPCSLECIIRRGYFEDVLMGTKSAVYPPREAPRAGPGTGFYFTVYVFGYGDDQSQARQRWPVALKLAENALLQLAGKISQEDVSE